jgi:hypothetical protein
MKLLREYLRCVLSEYWGEPVASAIGKADGTKADPPGLRMAGPDPFFLDAEEGVMVPKNTRKKIKKYFKDMKLSPTNEPGKTYK